ncbi:MAG: WxL domain-containing protein, partial [Oscillospiraceae bacterium]|nr:WxL domain-containing protein [Oscillospiraceae bacterium]
FTEALLPRTDANWHLTVRDTRADADEGWNLSLKLASPFTSAVDGVSTLPNTGGWGLVMADGLGGFHSLDGTAYPIASKNYRPGDVPDEDTLDIGWAAERGLMLRVPPATPVVEGDYCATLTWTLSVGP